MIEMNIITEILTDTKSSGLNPNLFNPKATLALLNPGGCLHLAPLLNFAFCFVSQLLQ